MFALRKKITNNVDSHKIEEVKDQKNALGYAIKAKEEVMKLKMSQSLISFYEEFELIDREDLQEKKLLVKESSFIHVEQIDSKLKTTKNIDSFKKTNYTLDAQCDQSDKSTDKTESGVKEKEDDSKTVLSGDGSGSSSEACSSE